MSLAELLEGSVPPCISKCQLVFRLRQPDKLTVELRGQPRDFLHAEIRLRLEVPELSLDSLEVIGIGERCHGRKYPTERKAVP